MRSSGSASAVSMTTAHARDGSPGRGGTPRARPGPGSIRSSTTRSGCFCLDRVERVAAVAELAGGVPGPLEVVDDDRGHRVVVVDDQDVCHALKASDRTAIPRRSAVGRHRSVRVVRAASALASKGCLHRAVPILDIVLPCLDEAAALPWVLSRIPAGARAIVVDNGSTDGSADIARAAGGVGRRVRRAGLWRCLPCRLAGGDAPSSSRCATATPPSTRPWRWSS